MTYEHKLVSIGSQTKDDYIEGMLRDMESKGFELITVVPGIGLETRYFFKRQLDGAKEVLAPLGRQGGRRRALEL
jgi:hypothetical protein